jgi:oxygen-independent coproporphyrinogen III oxidase
MDRLIGALEQEMVFYKHAFTQFDSLFIGGGTPTLLNPGQIASLFDALRSHFAFSTDSEITVEANPDDVDDAYLEALKSLGVNRLSLGIQSFNDEELVFLRRRHNAARAADAIEAAIRARFSNISLDLIYGLPGQTEDSWKGTMERALSFGPKHLSCYQLTVEEHTPLGIMVNRGQVQLPDEETETDLFLATSRFLESHGFVHYEVSNFALSEDYACRHNRKYWRHAPYLGLGPAAHSFDGSQRWWNCRSVERYCEALGKREKPVEDREVLSREQLELERLYLGLRTRDGIELNDLSEKSLPFLRELRRAGLVGINENRVIPSARGYLVADSLPVLLSR